MPLETMASAMPRISVADVAGEFIPAIPAHRRSFGEAVVGGFDWKRYEENDGREDKVWENFFRETGHGVYLDVRDLCSLGTAAILWE